MRAGGWRRRSGCGRRRSRRGRRTSRAENWQSGRTWTVRRFSMTQAAALKGEVWLVNLDPSVGDEIRKTRPAVIMSGDALGILALRAVVPLTNWQERFKNWE